jgi:transcriptional regulator PpsR
VFGQYGRLERIPRERAVVQSPGRRTDLSALSEFAPELAATFARVAGDVALVLDSAGVIENVELGADELASLGDWIGRSWVDTATHETRRKLEQLLKETVSTGVSRRREVNHPVSAGVEIPVAWAAVRLGEGGRVLAVGRDLRAIAAIQQRFMESQQQLERDYWQGRREEARYSALFHVATDAVFVLEAESLSIVEMNRAASHLLDLPPEALIGRTFVRFTEAASQPGVEELLARARSSGQPAELRARLAGRALLVTLSAAPFRSDDGMLLMVRAHAVGDDIEAGQARLISLVERLPDGVVITDSSGRVTMANPAFLSMSGCDSESAVTGRSLDEWLTPAGTDFASLLAAVRRGGIVARLGVRIRSRDRRESLAECAAVLLPEGDQECIGFTLRRSTAAVARSAPELTDRIERLTAQMGSLDLPALIREVTQHAERHFLRVALDRTRGQLGDAARMLGISEDALRADLRRLQLPADATPGTAPPRAG